MRISQKQPLTTFNDKLLIEFLGRNYRKILKKNSWEYGELLLRFFIIFLLNFQYISNIQVLNQTGNEDLCYYNFLCAHPLGLLSGTRNTKKNIFKKTELKILEWWISRFMRDPLFFLISRLYPEKCIKFNKSEPINLIFCAPFKIIYRNGRNSLI